MSVSYVGARSALLRLTLSLATGATLLLAGCGGSSTTSTPPRPTARAQASSTPVSTPPAVVNVQIVTEPNGMYTFDPATLAVKVGTLVIWTNDTSAPHTVTSETDAFNTPDILTQNQTFMVVFTKPGTTNTSATFISICSAPLSSPPLRLAGLMTRGLLETERIVAFSDRLGRKPEQVEPPERLIMGTIFSLNRRLKALALLGSVGALVLVGCGGSTSTTPTPTATQTRTTATATLAHIPQGTAVLSYAASGQTLTVKLDLVGLAPNSLHPAHIHQGSCANQGAVVYPLQTVVADAHGVASVTSTVPQVRLGSIPATGWYVNVHNGPALSPDDQFLPIVCGDVVNSSAAPSVTVMLTAAPPASAGESASGMANLTLTGTTLTVVVTLSGLEPNSAHAAHIHSGSCKSQGAVVYPLQPVMADASGNASVTSVIQNVAAIPSTGWYVNIHHHIDLTTQTGFDPVACGNVTLG